MTDFFTCTTINLAQSEGFPILQQLKYSCKYLTYKEWKRFGRFRIRFGRCRKYLTYKEWKLYCTVIRRKRNFSVSTLPIRNGNPAARKATISTTVKTVSTLPIRNGNHPFPAKYLWRKILIFLQRKYLTYKEWKLIRFTNSCPEREVGKYLTYKEWKLIHSRHSLKTIFKDPYIQ